MVALSCLEVIHSFAFNPPNAEGCNGEFYKNRKQADGPILGNPSCINSLAKDRPGVTKYPKM